MLIWAKMAQGCIQTRRPVKMMIMLRYISTHIVWSYLVFSMFVLVWEEAKRSREVRQSCARRRSSCWPRKFIWDCEKVIVEFFRLIEERRKFTYKNYKRNNLTFIWSISTHLNRVELFLASFGMCGDVIFFSFKTFRWLKKVQKMKN